LKPDGTPGPSKQGVEAPPPPAPRPDAGADVDRALAERAGAGDSAAFRELLVRHQDRAFGLALRILRSRPDAEEAAQDAFLKAWRGLAGFRGDSSFATWLYRIVARTALDRARTLGARRRRETPLESPDALPDMGPPQGVDEERDRQRMIVSRLVGQLPDLQRAVVALYYYEDRSVDRVAETLELPIGTVKTHLHRARATLRRMWTREEGIRNP
jgi:RNA polymerase sigma-70 factor, ECF subfamily